MLKNLAPGTQALLQVDQAPQNPRQQGNTITTIVAWHSQWDITDTDEFDTPQSFQRHILFQDRPDLRDLLDEDTPQSLEDCPPELREHLRTFRYPGVICNLYLHQQSEDEVILSTAPRLDLQHHRQIGYVLITGETMAELDLPRQEARRTIDQELACYQDCINGFVYVLLIQRHGQVEDACGNIHPARETPDHHPQHVGDSLPDEQELNCLLGEMDLTDDERARIDTSPWEQPD